MDVNPSEVSAVIVTRGDVDTMAILNELADVGFAEVIVWQNGSTCWDATGRDPRPIAEAPDLKVYGRYAAIKYCKSDIIYVQDDDCLIPAVELLRHPSTSYALEGRIVANMPDSRWLDYPDSCLVGWGSVFMRWLPALAWGRFCERHGEFMNADEMFLRTCDVVFSTLCPHVKVDVGFQHLPWAEDPQRAMFKQPGHKAERDAMLELARAARP